MDFGPLFGQILLMFASTLSVAVLAIAAQTGLTDRPVAIADICHALDARTFDPNERITTRATFLLDMRHGDFIHGETGCSRGLEFHFAKGSQAEAAWGKVQNIMLGLDASRRSKLIYLVLDGIKANLHGHLECPDDELVRCWIDIDKLTDVALPPLAADQRPVPKE